VLAGRKMAQRDGAPLLHPFSPHVYPWQRCPALGVMSPAFSTFLLALSVALHFQFGVKLSSHLLSFLRPAERMEAQLAELQRKYRIMQGDKQAYAESSSLTLRKQRYVCCFVSRHRPLR